MYSQLIPFNQSTAGTVKLECEKNVRLGFGIDWKYTSAWQNWVNTDQHTDAIPTGVDVPVFFSYIDTQNGHIGVRLANGKFWSDGNTYDSIQAYEANHTPKYVGWSTKVDDVAVIKQGETMTFPNKGDLVNFYNATGWPGHPPNDNDVAYWTTGTNNPKWNMNDAGATFKALTYDIADYVSKHPKPVSSTTLAPGVYKVN